MRLKNYISILITLLTQAVTVLLTLQLLHLPSFRVRSVATLRRLLTKLASTAERITTTHSNHFMTKINEADVVEIATTVKGVEQPLLSTSNISIVNIFKKINPQDKNFLKYIPDEFLNAEQKKAKASALDIEAEKYGKKDNADSNL